MLLLLVIALLLTYSPAYAAIINIAACTPAALTDAVTESVNGDTLQFPNCNVGGWAATVVINNKNVHIKGNGVTNTKIRQTGGSRMIRFEGRSNFSICCMSLQGRQGGNEQLGDIGLSFINPTDFKVHDMELYHFGMAMEFAGNPQAMRGVIYSNNIHHNAKYLNGVLGYGMEVRGNLDNYPAIELGTLNNVFIEDNYFEANRHSIAGIGGARYVVRYNTFVNSRENATPIDAHGPSNAAYTTGTRQYEIYNNLITNAVDIFGAIGIRGGDGVIFNNVATGFTKPMRLWMEDGGIAPGCNCVYPCPNQTVDLWLWGNSFTQVWHKDDACHAVKLQNGRDYHFAQKAGYNLTVVTGMPDFPPGKTVVYSGTAIYPHPLRNAEPPIVPGAPQSLRVTPIP